MSIGLRAAVDERLQAGSDINTTTILFVLLRGSGNPTLNIVLNTVGLFCMDDG